LIESASFQKKLHAGLSAESKQLRNAALFESGVNNSRRQRLFAVSAAGLTVWSNHIDKEKILLSWHGSCGERCSKRRIASPDFRQNAANLGGVSWPNQ
jgi:hypothetical protein